LHPSPNGTTPCRMPWTGKLMQQRLREAIAVERRPKAERSTLDVLRAQGARAPAVPIRRERVAQYWTPAPLRGHCECRLEVFGSLRGFSTVQ